MITFTFYLLSLIALGAAQNQTVSLLLPDTDLQSLVGSIVGADATATTYVVQCANGGAAAATTDATAAAAVTTDTAGAAVITDFADGDVCGFPTPVTIVEGPSTVAYAVTEDDSTISINCVLSGTSTAVCTASATGALLTQVSTVPTLTTATLTGTDIPYLPIVITAGSVGNTASKPTATTASTTGAAGAGKGGSTSSTGSSNSNGGTQTQSGSSTAPSTKASGAAVHMGPMMGVGAAGALAAIAAAVL